MATVVQSAAILGNAKEDNVNEFLREFLPPGSDAIPHHPLLAKLFFSVQFENVGLSSAKTLLNNLSSG
jgi:hypothetical protein